MEIYQNCNIFNDGIFDDFTDRRVKSTRQLRLQAGQPMVFGENNERGLRLNPQKLCFEDVNVEEVGIEKIARHDPANPLLGQLLASLDFPDFPVPLGVIHQHKRATYDAALNAQISSALPATGRPSVQSLLNSGDTWTVND